MDNDVILVNSDDQQLGSMNKLEAHQRGALHRAFSIFIFNSRGELLIQKRAREKYHSPSLWTNTCCSHPQPGETTMMGANRRLVMEMGMKVELSHQFQFYYKSDFENGLIEHEVDHVFFGYSDCQPLLNTNEASDWEYISLGDLLQKIELTPELFTSWFKICLPKVISIVESEQLMVVSQNKTT